MKFVKGLHDKNISFLVTVKSPMNEQKMEQLDELLKRVDKNLMCGLQAHLIVKLRTSIDIVHDLCPVPN